MQPQPDDIGSLIRIGQVVAVDLSQAKCRVQYGDPDSDDEAETDWIDWLAPRAGALRIWSAPSIGEQVLLLCPDGQIGAAVALPGIWCDAFPPPAGDGTWLAAFDNGARISYDPVTGELAAKLPAGGRATITAPGGIRLTGPVHVEGALTVSQGVTAQGDVKGAGVSLATHRHTGVQPGSGQTATPT